MKLSSKEEQRYGRNKETVINRAYVESGEYRRKFDKISDNAELNKLLYQLAKKMLIHRSGTLYEDMYWVDPETLQVVAAETECDKEQCIVYSNATRKVIRRREGLLTIHSHPNSFPPSLEDFNSNYVHNNGKGIVCGHDGRVYVYGAEEWIAAESHSFYEKKNFMDSKDEDEAQRKTWEDLKTQYKIYFEEV